MLYLVPSLQVPEPTALVEVAYQVYEIVLLKEVRHSLDPQDPRLLEFLFQVPKDDGVLETFQGLFQVHQVLNR